MTAQEKLTILKSDLQMLTSVNDAYLTYLLTAAEAAINREGVINDTTADYEACVISYAAWLFRKRAASTAGSGGFAPSGGETAMPRFLRWQLNNLLMSQKANGLKNTDVFLLAGDGDYITTEGGS